MQYVVNDKNEVSITAFAMEKVVEEYHDYEQRFQLSWSIKTKRKIFPVQSPLEQSFSLTRLT